MLFCFSTVYLCSKTKTKTKQINNEKQIKNLSPQYIHGVNKEEMKKSFNNNEYKIKEKQ